MHHTLSVSWLFCVTADYDKIVSSGLAMLSDAVQVSSESNLVSISAPSLSAERTRSWAGCPLVPPEILHSQIDSASFSQLCSIAFVHLRLGYYRNQLMHLFVEDAMLAVCLAPEIDYGVCVCACVHTHA